MIANRWLRWLGSASTERQPPHGEPSIAPARAPDRESGEPTQANNGRDILCFQTSDPYNYYDILVQTGRTVRQYCQKHGIRYEAYIGTKRGYFAWQACYNRIIMLKEIIDSGFRGWAFYLDADAYIADQDFDLHSYLQDKATKAVIFSESDTSGKWFHINDGVFLLNTGVQQGRDLVALWLDKFMEISDRVLESSPAWHDIPHDQDLLHLVLRDNQHFRDWIHLESLTLLNSGYARFVRQFLRSSAADLGERRRIIKAIVDELLGAAEASVVVPGLSRAQAIIIVDALYKSLLGRMMDPGGLNHYASLLCERGLEYGFQRIVEDLLQSDEFKSRFAPTVDAAVNGYQAGLIASALYRSLFGREPDWHAFNAIPPVLHSEGLEKGLQHITEDIIASEEFLVRMETARQFDTSHEEGARPNSAYPPPTRGE
jgi:hypothetical protein